MERVVSIVILQEMRREEVTGSQRGGTLTPVGRSIDAPVSSRVASNSRPSYDLSASTTSLLHKPSSPCWSGIADCLLLTVGGVGVGSDIILL